MSENACYCGREYTVLKRRAFLRKELFSRKEHPIWRVDLVVFAFSYLSSVRV